MFLHRIVHRGCGLRFRKGVCKVSWELCNSILLIDDSSDHVAADADFHVAIVVDPDRDDEAKAGMVEPSGFSERRRNSNNRNVIVPGLLGLVIIAVIVGVYYFGFCPCCR